MDVKSILRKIMGSIYLTLGVRKTAFNFLRREIRSDIVVCLTYREEVVTQFLYSCIIQYIDSTSAYLNAVLRGKLPFDVDSDKNKNANSFVKRAAQHYKTSIKSKNTYSTLSRM